MSLYRILIVDDEPLIRRGIRATIDWASMGFEIAGEARDGAEGLRLIEELRPDVVLTDIRMPVMDGMEMLAAATGRFPDILYVILSGFEEFDYAKRAIGLGVSDYISKLTLDQEAQEIFPRLRERLDRRQGAIESALSVIGRKLAAQQTENARTAESADSADDPLKVYDRIRDAAWAAQEDLTEQDGGQTGRAVSEARQFIKEHYCEKVSLETIAKTVHLSPAYLSGLFTKTYGVSIGAYITQLRMEKAKEYLRRGYSVSKTAEMTGYADMRHFGKMFKNHADGLTPSEWAERERKQEAQGRL